MRFSRLFSHYILIKSAQRFFAKPSYNLFCRQIFIDCFRSDLARAQQQSKQAGSSVLSATSNINATHSLKEEARVDMENLQRDDVRYEQLLRVGGVSQHQYDQTHTAYLAAKARYDQICHTIDMQQNVADEQGYGRSASEAAVKYDALLAE